LAAALVGVVTLAAATPTFARSWRPWAAAGAGFAAGAIIGAAAANSRAYYGPGYYGYGPGYSGGYYAPGYESYAYAPPPAAYERAPTVTYRSRYLDPKSSCANAGNYGRLDYSSC
jgi:hypothetical protein